MTSDASPLVLLLAPALAIIVAWWASTAMLLVLVGRSKRARRTTLLVLSVGASAALAASWALRSDESVLGAYAGVAAGLVIWAWHEFSFLGGFVTGPRRIACPEDASGWRRFRYGAAALAHHEVALGATLAGLLLISAGAANQAALWTFALLFGMRLSAKLNLFLGVAHVGAALLPSHLAYIASYFRRAPMNPLMPVSLLAGAALTAHLLQAAQIAATPGAAVQAALLAALAALAVLEHALMVAPAGPGGGGWDDTLWRWALKARAASELSASSTNDEHPSDSQRRRMMGLVAPAGGAAPTRAQTPRTSVEAPRQNARLETILIQGKDGASAPAR